MARNPDSPGVDKRTAFYISGTLGRLTGLSFITLFVLSVALFSPASAAAHEKSRVAPDLQEETGKGSPARMVRLVITLDGADPAQVAARVAELGGTVRGHFHHVGAMSLELPLDAVGALAELAGVKYVAPDRQVAGLASQLDRTTGASSVFPGMLSPDGDVASGGALPVVLDSISRAAGPAANGTTLTWSHTIGSGPDRILVVGVSLRDGNTSVTGVTYGGAPLTLIGFQTAGGGQNRTEMWRLLAPPAGTAGIAVTLSAAKRVVGGAASFFNVDQTTPHGPFSSAIGSGATAAVTVPSTRGELVVNTVTANGDAVSLTAGSDQTSQWSAFSGNGDAGNARGGGSSEPGASYVTMSWALGAAKPWSAGAVSLKPVGEPSFGGYDGSGVAVAVLDSGIAKGHLDLIRSDTKKSTVVLGVDFTGAGKLDDPFGHGSHVAGVIAGDGSESYALGRDYTGVARGVSLVNFKVLDDYGRGHVSNVIAAIDYAISVRALYNIRVINLSLAAPPIDSYVDDPLCQAVARAVQAGIVVVAAAGNFGQDPYGNKMYGSVTSPGISPAAITVGAANTRGTDTRSDDVIAPFSSRGPTLSHSIDPVTGAPVYDNLAKPDLVAPGARIVSLERDNNYLVAHFPAIHVDGTKSNSRYMMLSGTSMSAGVVSGAVALMLQANPSLAPNQVKAILMYTAQIMNGPDLFEQGAGLLNVDGAVRVAAQISSTADTTLVGQNMVRGQGLPAPQSLISGETVAWSESLIWGFGALRGQALLTTQQTAYTQSLIWGIGRLDAWGAGVTYYDGLYSSSYVAFGGNNQWNYVTWDSGTPTASGLIWTRELDASGLIWGDRVISSDFFDVSSSSLIWGINGYGGYDLGLIWGIDGAGLIWGAY